MSDFASDLSWKIFLDRYTLKDLTRAFAVGDLALVVTEPHPRWPKKEVARVTALADDRVTVTLLTGPHSGDTLTVPRIACDRPLETTLATVAARVARGIAAVEPDPDRREAVYQAFADAITRKRWVPGGRVWAGAGTDQQLTYFNCYVLPTPHDSREGIVETLRQMIEIMSRGGGVGINVSSLRPYRAPVRGVNGRSSGAVSWMDLYSRATGLVEQGGCFGPATRIATTQGLIPAAELWARMEAGETFDALTHEGPRPITAHFRNGVQPLFRVRTQRGFTVDVTLTHKMGVLRQGRITTVPLADLRIGDEILTFLGEGVAGQPVALPSVSYVPSAHATTLNTAVQFPAVLDPRLAYVLGYLAANGSVIVERRAQRVIPKGLALVVPHTQPAVLDRMVTWLRTLFGLEPLVRPGDGACWVIRVYSRLLMTWLETQGLLKSEAARVRVPEVIFRSPSDVIGAFVAGYFDADGCDRGSKGGFGIDSVSPDLVHDLQQLLVLHGIVSHVTVTDRRAPGWAPLYRLSVTGHVFKARFRAWAALSLKMRHRVGQRTGGISYPADIREAVGFAHRHFAGVWDGTSSRISYPALTAIRDRLAREARTAAAAAAEGLLHVLPDPIVAIDPLEADETYDFEVAETHMLSGNGVYTSNSRRGALMLQLDDWHPDLWRFIDVKKTPGVVENANISVRISDAFMQAVKADGSWDLVFPDTTDPEYDTLWDGNLAAWRARGKPVVHYETVKARDLWRAIITGAWQAAEPGVVFSDRHEADSNSVLFDRLVCTNPCGEQPLPAWGVCTLGHVNLAAHWDPERQDVDWTGLEETVRLGVRFLDNVIDATPYFFPENQAQQQRERRIGLGTLGLGELLIRLKLRYGSPESVAFCDTLYQRIAYWAYDASCQLAAEKGAFPAWDPATLNTNAFVARMARTFPDLDRALRQHGMRNVTLLTQAPTGTVGTMMETSTGIEPFYALTYFRQSRLGFDKQAVAVAQEWLDAHPDEPLPEYFVGALDLTPEDHVRVQAAIQRWTDSSISKTANAPQHYTIDDTERLYMLAYDLGCKGVTIYRDHSRDDQVLHQADAAPQAAAPPPGPAVTPVPSIIAGQTFRQPTPAGTARVVINEADGQPFEVFLLLGRAGSEVQSFMEAIGRLISIFLRSADHLTPRERLALIADQLQGIGGAQQMGFGPQRVLSVVDAVGHVLTAYLQGNTTPASEPRSTSSEAPVYDLCPECGGPGLVFEDGCQHCTLCGASRC